ncbi:hypothetical protein Ae168Ps1_2660c [Pseudonocardia sp. Ae168_Ps1]|nr:hypothetical protein Ae150APs1_2651c [Pseudonocardia sp. Ae150A_Ps1]OLL80254.1 hypothetical protein Ae168Ps1_2660c [Pseudonocardia sp. Ae168_Ps1]OLL85619.1 hypothetical protein Ae263Ps1_2674 [Pseudonocardia sp. Ae263_Ps1]OLL94353.1 hypothetical protein Ae356Ps1_4250c [Pseudonocardia sp. Ae356_Ps1]
MMVLGVAAVAVTSFVGALGPAPDAEAVACGYSRQLEDVPPTGFSAALGPISAPIGGGQRQIGHWGNCSPGNQKVAVQQANGAAPTVCVTPGDTRLGLATGSEGITGATAQGGC